MTLEELAQSGCQDCVSITYFMDPMEGWLYEILDCSLDNAIRSHDLDELAAEFAKQRALSLGRAHNFKDRLEDGNKAYLAFTYLLGPEKGKQDFIGPFHSIQEARVHREFYGPLDAEVMVLQELPEDKVGVMSVKDHIEYMQGRV